MALASFRLSTDGVGRGTAEVNGTDISDGVRAFTVTAGVGDITEVHIAAYSTLELEGQGVVYVDQGFDQQQAVLAWLDSLDASALESAALDGPDLLAGGTTGELFLGVLKRWARGD